MAQLAIEAVLLKGAEERIDVAGAVEELRKSSFVDVVQSKQDGQSFVSLPLVASIFGKRKLEVSTMKSAIQSDMPLLYLFGAAQSSATDQGLLPRLNKLFRSIARDTAQDISRFEHYIPMLEIIARSYPPAWRLLASLYEESSLKDGMDRAQEALRSYLETSPSNQDRRDAWRRIVALCQRSIHILGEIQAHVELSQLPDATFSEISNSANRLNQLFAQTSLVLDNDQKNILVRQFAVVMETRISEGDATDCSRLAWLFLNVHNPDHAKQYAERGLALDPGNSYCTNLVDRLQRDADFRNSPY